MEARPPSARYRLGKFLRRNKGPVLATGLVGLALLAGIVGTTYGLIRADSRRVEAEQAQAKEADQRTKAEKARDRTRQALDAMTSSVTDDSLSTQKEISAEQKKFLTEVLTYYQEFAGEKAEDEPTRARSAEAAGRVGFIEYRLGRKVEAAAAAGQALAGHEKLAADFPSVPEYQLQLAGCHNNLGILLHDLGRRPEAEQHYRKALAIPEQLAADLAGMPKYRQMVAYSHYNLGRLLKELRKRPEAEQHFRKALTLHGQLAADFPSVPQCRQGLANSHNSLGTVLSDLEKRPEAVSHYRKALVLQEKLAADFPAVPKYRQELANSQNNLGLLLVDLGKRPEAEQLYREALALKEQLVADFPKVPTYRMELANSHNNLGMLLDDLGKRPEAEKHYREALALKEQLTADFPAVAGYQVNLGGGYCNFGNLVLNRGQPGESLEWYDKAIHTLSAVYETDRRLLNAQWFLRNSYGGRALAYDRLTKYAEAVKDWTKAIELSPVQEQPAYRQKLAASHNRHGNLLTRQGKRPEAEQQFRQALAIQEPLAADFPTVLPDYQVALGGTYCNFANLVRDRGQPDHSLAWFDKAIRILSAVYEKDSRLVEAKQFLRNTHLGRAMAYDRLRKYSEAVNAWDRVVKLRGCDSITFRRHKS